MGQPFQNAVSYASPTRARRGHWRDPGHIVLRPMTALMVAVVCLPILTAEDTWTARYEMLRRARDQRLVELAEELAAADGQAADAVRFRAPPRDPGREYYFVPGESNSSAGDSSRADGIQREYAASLYELAREAAKDQRESLAFTWLHEVCANAPDHQEARRILGYRLREGGWTQYADLIEKRRARAKHPLLPWAEGTYERIESANYEVASTADPQVTIELVKRLERWRTVWLQAYYEFWAPPGLVTRRLDAGAIATRARGNKHRVVLFRDRQQYVDTLAGLGVNGVEQSTGYYNDRHETIFLYHDAQPDLETWLQEQCHQLCQEIGSAKSDPVEKSHIWVVEGLGMYFESLVEFDEQQFVTLGGWDASRLQFARIRWTREGQWMPIEELTALSREEFQSHPQVAALYSQAAGLTHFLMRSGEGQYRSAFLQLAKQVYTRRARSDSLAELTGADLTTLTVACQQWLPVKAPQVREHVTLPESRTQLALGFSDVDSAAVKAIGGCINLRWLQLSRTAVDDEIGPTLGGLIQLQQLFLDDTRVTDQLLPHLLKLTQLEELDLAETSITDEGLRVIGKMRQLKVLWLGGTQVTDAGLEYLRDLKSLEMLDLEGARTTDAGRQKLHAVQPSLKFR